MWQRTHAAAACAWTADGACRTATTRATRGWERRGQSAPPTCHFTRRARRHTLVFRGLLACESAPFQVAAPTCLAALVLQPPHVLDAIGQQQEGAEDVTLASGDGVAAVPHAAWPEGAMALLHPARATPRKPDALVCAIGWPRHGRRERRKRPRAYRSVGSGAMARVACEGGAPRGCGSRRRWWLREQRPLRSTRRGGRRCSGGWRVRRRTAGSSPRRGARRRCRRPCSWHLPPPPPRTRQPFRAHARPLNTARSGGRGGLCSAAPREKSTHSPAFVRAKSGSRPGLPSRSRSALRPAFQCVARGRAPHGARERASSRGCRRRRGRRCAGGSHCT